MLPKIKACYAYDATAGVDFHLPAYNIRGNFQTISRFLIQKIYRFNPETEAAVMKLTGTVALPDRYVGFQIRGGDKHYETSLRSVEEYIQRAEQLTDLRHAFLSTDDYRLYEMAVASHPNWQFVTLCHPSEDGYDHLNFMAQPFHERKGSYYNLFTCMEILRKADLFVGTYSSNLGVFLGMCMDPCKCEAIDFDHFHYWWPE